MSDHTVTFEARKLRLKNQFHSLAIIKTWIKRYVTANFEAVEAEGSYVFVVKDNLEAVRIEILLDEVEKQGYPSRHRYITYEN